MSLTSNLPLINIAPQYLDDYKRTASDAQPDVDIAKLILYTQANVRGVVCGPRLLFEQMIRAHEQAYLRAGMYFYEVTDSTFHERRLAARV